MADLGITFGGLRMRNPIGIAPLDPAIAYARRPKVQADWLLRHVEAGAGYLYLAGTRPRPAGPQDELPAQKFLKIQCPGFARRESIHSTGDINAMQFSLDVALEVMALVKPQLPADVPLIAQPNVAGADLEEWRRLCRVFQEAGADALELNFCPISAAGKERSEATELIDRVDTLEMRTLRRLGLAPGVGEIPEVLAVVVRACVEAVDIPVGLKPSAEVGFPKCVALAKLSADAGAAWVANVTAGLTVAPPDIMRAGRSPWEKVGLEINPFAGTSGPTNRYHARKTTATVAKFVPEIDVMAIGGLVNPEHVVEMLMLGAKTVGLSSGFFWKGRRLLTDSVTFLERFLDRQGYESVRDIVGLGLRYVQPVDDTVDWKVGRIAARVDPAKCTRCGVCSDSLCPVPVAGADGVPFIDKTNCQACGMCVATCPAGAIQIAAVSV
jgi:dihydropyrimidine dehydrogenase (NAD+) subunit PreA